MRVGPLEPDDGAGDGERPIESNSAANEWWAASGTVDALSPIHLRFRSNTRRIHAIAPLAKADPRRLRLYEARVEHNTLVRVTGGRMKPVVTSVVDRGCGGGVRADPPRRSGRTYPSGDVPKNAKGEPDMNAPAPRTPDGKPDFSGSVARSAAPVDGARPRPFRRRERRRSPRFRDVAQNIPGGLPITARSSRRS